MNYGDKRTGRENTVIMWCTKCGACSGPKPWPIIAVGEGETQCCGAGMRFVAYEAGAEDRIAALIVEVRIAA